MTKRTIATRLFRYAKHAKGAVQANQLARHVAVGLGGLADITGDHFIAAKPEQAKKTVKAALLSDRVKLHSDLERVIAKLESEGVTLRFKALSKKPTSHAIIKRHQARRAERLNARPVERRASADR